MVNALLYFASISSIAETVMSCVATSPGTSPVTTTTTTTTTAAPAAGCATCTQGQITFEQSDGGIRIDSSGIFSTDATTGCLSLVATCTADEGFTAFMQFNVDQGGPAENQNAGRTINAALSCVDGNWVYSSGGVSRTVTDVSCNQAQDAG